MRRDNRHSLNILLFYEFIRDNYKFSDVLKTIHFWCVCVCGGGLLVFLLQAPIEKERGEIW